MTGTNIQRSSTNHGGGLTNLFALAHLAVMTEEERCIASSSRTSSPQTAASAAAPTAAPPKAATTRGRKVATSRQPAKKRAVPADFDMTGDSDGNKASSSHTVTGAGYKKQPSICRRSSICRRLTVETTADVDTTGGSGGAAPTMNNAPSSSPTATSTAYGFKKPSSTCRRLTVETTSPPAKSLSSPPSSSTSSKRPRLQEQATTKTTSKSSTTTKPNKRGSMTFKMKANQPSFPVILMGIMSAPLNKEYITFLSDGQRFIIVHPAELAKNILPIHFEENVPTYDQFLYLLAIWGFEITKDPQYPHVSFYKHPMFRKGDWESCLKIKLPDPNDQQVNVEAIQKARGGQGEGVGNIDNNHRLLPEPPASPRRDEAAIAAVANGDSPPSTVRSVTPPTLAMPLSDNAQLEQGAANSRHTVSTQTQQRPQQSNSGAKLASVEKKLLYYHLLQESMRTQGSLRDDFNQGRPYSSMLDTMSSLNHRRASLGVMPNSMPSASCQTMPRMNGRMSMLFTMGFGDVRPQQQQQQQVQSRTMKHITPSDDEVRAATNDIVSAALDALRPMQQQHVSPQKTSKPVPRSRRHTFDCGIPSSGATTRLDAMTNVFLERSMARLQSRPAIMGPRPPLAVSPPMQHQPSGIASRQSFVSSIDAEVEALTQAALSAAAQQERRRQKVRMLGHLGM